MNTMVEIFGVLIPIAGGLIHVLMRLTRVETKVDILLSKLLGGEK